MWNIEQRLAATVANLGEMTCLANRLEGQRDRLLKLYRACYYELKFKRALAKVFARRSSLRLRQGHCMLARLAGRARTIRRLVAKPIHPTPQYEMRMDSNGFPCAIERDEYTVLSVVPSERTMKHWPEIVALLNMAAQWRNRALHPSWADQMAMDIIHKAAAHLKPDDA